MKDDRLYLLHVRDACTRIMGYCRSGEAQFRTELVWESANVSVPALLAQVVELIERLGGESLTGNEGAGGV